MSHIFISYSHHDRECANRLHSALTNARFDVWRDEESIRASENWSESIDKGLEQASIYLILWSKDAKQSDFVGDEIKHAKSYCRQHSKTRRMLIVILDDTKLDPTLSQIQYIKLTPCDDNGIERIVSIVEQICKLDPQKALGEQVHQTRPDGLVRVFYANQAHHLYRAEIIGKSSRTFVEPPSDLYLILQFTRSVGDDMVGQVLDYVNDENAVALHIVGPITTDGTQYTLNPDRRDIWEAGVMFTGGLLRLLPQMPIATSNKTTLHIFALAPSPVVAGIARWFDRFWHVKFYHYDSPNRRYVFAVDQPPRPTN